MPFNESNEVQKAIASALDYIESDDRYRFMLSFTLALIKIKNPLPKKAGSRLFAMVYSLRGSFPNSGAKSIIGISFSVEVAVFFDIILEANL